MQIQINGTTKNFQEESFSVMMLLHSENIMKTEGIAVAVNNEVVPKTEWQNFKLINDDKVLIIRAAQGG